MTIDPEIIAGLPVSSVADKVNGCLLQGRDVVLTAAPGAGKSTLIPLTVLQGAIPDGGRILMLEPRRLAARQIASRMAFLAGESVGETVGYSIRFEHRVSARTRIEVITEGILTRRLISDPTLEGVSAIIFDEFHERSLESDLALALTLDCRGTLRPDLRIIIMSATIDSAGICDTLGASHIDSPGRMFPVTVEHAPREILPSECAREVARAVSIACRRHEGDILAFLPGEAEILRCRDMLEGTLGDDIRIFPLYGMLDNAAQKEAIAPSPEGSRKIVLATPIAETSITIEGVRTVIDSGLCRKMVFDARNGLSHLETVRISMDMARQRSGRAGRTAPGYCLRLWTEAAERRMEECRRPEILDADLCPLALNVASWEGSPMEALPWMTPPPKAAVTLARRTLGEIGAIDGNGRATPHGRHLASLPCHPKIAQMLASARTGEQKALAADIAAVLEYEKSPRFNDIAPIINDMRRNRKKFAEISRASEQYCRIAGTRTDDGVVGSEECGLLLALSYPDRIAKAVEGRQGYYLTAGGEMISSPREDEISTSEWIVAAIVSARAGADGRIFLAARLDPRDLKGLSREIRNVGWSAREGRVIARDETRIGKLVLETRESGKIPPETALNAICEAAQRDGAAMFDFGPEVQNLQRRIAMVSKWHPEMGLPPVDTDSVLKDIRRWGPVFLNGASTLSELKRTDMCEVIWSMLDYESRGRVEKLAPSHIEVPTGSRIRIEYRQGAELPVLKVRLQECFGLEDTPRVDGGRLPVLMELLSPGYKPVQLTSDLRSFWNGTYFEVRKELRLRYPKHSWPENPLEAQAVRGVRKNH